MNKYGNIIKVEAIGIIAILTIGFLFHEFYKITGNTFLAFICPVNESKWEHWKIAFWPMIIISILEYMIIKKEISSFVFPLAVGVISFEIITFGFIELFEIFIGEAHLPIHITIFVLGGVLGQVIKCILMIRLSYSEFLFKMGLGIILIHIIIISLFTFKPPQFQYFKDSITGNFGIK